MEVVQEDIRHLQEEDQIIAADMKEINSEIRAILEMTIDEEIEDVSEPRDMIAEASLEVLSHVEEFHDHLIVRIIKT